MTDTPTPSPGGRRVARRRIVLVGLVLPLLAATVLVWATSNRPEHLDRVPVAVVNNDQIITKPQPMAAGRALAAALTQPGPGQSNLDWTLADTADAANGLASGDYYAVLTIPKDFSKAILSTGTDAPAQGKLTLVSNGAASTTVPYISEVVAAKAAAALGRQSTEGYLGQVYDGFNKLSSSTEKAASSAGQLADGTAQVADGADRVESGADELSSGLDQLSAGAAQLAQGTGELDAGAVRLRTGAGEVADGAAELATGSRALATGARTLARGSDALAADARRLDRGLNRVAGAVRELSLGTRAIALNVRVLARLCGRRGAAPRFCAALQRAADRATRLGQASIEVADGTDEVAAGGGLLAAGAASVARGADGLATGAGLLAGSAGRLATGADRVSAGATSLAASTVEIDEATGRLAAGASSSASAGGQLASGSASLASGAASANQGAHQLGQGLDQLAAQSPSYSSKQQKALTTVVSQPVALTTSVENAEHGNGWLLGVVLAVVLWLAALLGVLRRDLGPVLRQSGTPLSSRRLAAVQLAPATALALGQGVAVLLALVLVRVDAASPVALGLLTVLAAVTFTLIGVSLRWAFGRAGIVAFVLLLLLQAAALGNVLPIETAPAPLPLLNRLLPLPVYVDASSQLVAGGAGGSLAAAVAVLVAWGIGASLAALLVVRRRRAVLPAPVPTPA
ncbi:DUF3533 domain-containing protein [Nocardioides sp. GY 10113]|uniref:YhgE/Pip family protein n=1 Tax=Nocardioides sp. GY 10113 TaxID=2569761 RepID=UPI0010A80B61|nr:YhgE/Pip family protein [Nocardioides sp. GY 10113]TIC88267.1 DUF3533 domain-containing protein [Nocardioides sp. GY 10113]